MPWPSEQPTPVALLEKPISLPWFFPKVGGGRQYLFPFTIFRFIQSCTLLEYFRVATNPPKPKLEIASI